MAVNTNRPAINELSQRECEILSLVAKGASNKEIAHDLHISTNTVKVHLRNIFSKIGASSRTEAAMYAVNAGIVDVKPVDLGAEPEGTGLSRYSRVLIGFGVTVGVLLLVLIGYFLYQDNFSGAQNSANQAVFPVEAGWEEKAQLLSPREGLALASYDGQIYAFAGETASGISQSVERYDPDTDRWSLMESKPTPVTDVSAAIIAGRIYLPGGLTPSGELSKALEIYSPIEDSWERGADLPFGISAYALVAYEGNLYLFGGWDGTSYLNSVFQYDPELDQWNVRTPMETPRAYAGAAVSGGKIFVVGGYDGSQALSSMEIYIPELDGSQINPWSEGPDLPSGRFGMGVTELGNMIHVVGGEVGQDRLPTSLVYLPQDGIWQEFENPTPDTISNIGLVPLETHLYLVGGQSDGQISGNNIAYQAIYTFVMPIIR